MSASLVVFPAWVKHPIANENSLCLDDLAMKGDSLIRERNLSGPPDSHATSLLQCILVVDGDPVSRHANTEVLIQHGYDVNEVEDAAAALEELQAVHYHLLITDYDLPKINGVKLIKKLRAARMTLPIIMVAGQLPAEELALHPSLQLAAALVKPVTAAVLLDTVKIVLCATHSHQEHRAEQASTITHVLQSSLRHHSDRAHLQK
ncbi:MAG: response regulator [Verrucomicrobiota bacterium]